MTPKNQFHFFSLGISLVNKEANTDVIIAWPCDQFPMADGELAAHGETYNAEGTDSFNGGYAKSMKTSIGIRCKYKNTNPNAMTSPDIRRNAKVLISRMANSDQFYWEPYTSTGNYQKLETVVTGYSNTQKEDEEPNPQNTWTTGVDTRNTKTINMGTTTRSDGEKFAYEAQIDAKNGHIRFKDDAGNMILLDSTNDLIRLQNSSGTFFELNGGAINYSCQTWKGDASSSMEESSPTKTGNYSSGQTTNTPNHDHVGNMALTGGFTGVGGVGGSGMKLTGDLDITGGITTTEDTVSGGISLITHTHTDSIGGTTTVPM